MFKKGFKIFIPLVDVNLGLAAAEGGVTTTTTTDSSQGEDDLLTAVNVGVEDTEDVLETRLLGNVQRLKGKEGMVSIRVRGGARPDGWISMWWKEILIQRDWRSYHFGYPGKMHFL